MRLLWTLIQRELLEDLTSSRYILTSVLCVILCLTSIILMSEDYKRRMERYNFLMADMTQEELLNRLSFAKRPQPLSVIARGVDEVMGRSLNITGLQPIEAPVAHVGGRSADGQHLYGFAQGQHLFALFTTPDFVYIVGVVLSVFATFLSFGMVCGEKQTRTLSLLLSHPIRRPTVLFAKWLGGYISLLISLCPALLLMLVFLTLSPVVSLQNEGWIRLAGIVGLSLIYLLVFFTLGLLISTLTHHPATALILVLSIWAIWVLGVPRIGCSAAKGLRPIQPNFAFGLNKRQVKLQGSFEEMQETLWKLDDKYIGTIDAQIEMAANFSRLSPFASFVYASTTLAQTSIKDAQNYRKQVSDWDRERRRGRPDQLLLPPFRLKKSFLVMANDLVLLVSWNAILFMGAYLVFLRYDVR